MLSRFRWVGWMVPLAVVVVLISSAGRARAQSLEEGWSQLDRASSTAHGRFLNLVKGEKFSSDDKLQAQTVDLVAKRQTYGIYLNNEKMMQPGEIEKAMKEFDGYITSLLNPKDREGLQPLSDAFRDKVRLHAREVIEYKSARPVHKIHNARLLAKVAVLGQPELADTLIALLKDANQNDGVRYYLFRAMAVLLSQVQPGTTNQVLNKDQQAKCAETLVEFLEQRKGPSKSASREEIDGFRILRREAVHALAQIHVPSFNDKVRPALVLARFAGDDERIQPPPRIDERVEAAIGLARMQSAKDKLYQPDYASAQIAKCLGAFGQQASKEYANKEVAPSHPWRIDAVLLKEALDTLKTESGGNKYVAQILDRADRLLKDVGSGRTIPANDLNWWNSPENEPAGKELFQGSADSTVKSADRSGEGS
jgi:hypothetical protein